MYKLGVSRSGCKIGNIIKHVPVRLINTKDYKKNVVTSYQEYSTKSTRNVLVLTENPPRSSVAYINRINAMDAAVANKEPANIFTNLTQVTSFL